MMDPSLQAHLLKQSRPCPWRKIRKYFRFLHILLWICHPSLAMAPPGVVLNRVSSSSMASVCFWHQGDSEVVTAGWAADVKHVCVSAVVTMETSTPLRMKANAAPLRFKTSRVKYFCFGPLRISEKKKKSFSCISHFR